MFYFVLAIFAIVVVGVWRLVHSPYGRVLSAIRQSETRAAHIGYPVWFYKLTVFALSAALSGLAGGLFAMAQLAAFPDVMSLHQSGLIVMMTLVGGGLVSFWGPLIGVVTFLIARDVIGALTNAWMLYFGLMFVALVLFRPEGIAGMIKSVLERRAMRTRGVTMLRLLFRSG
jgi:branched-chain amino acid transport system permease protein